MNTTKSPEFDGWRWVSFGIPYVQVVSFKKDVYRKAMKEFAQVMFGNEKTLLENTQEHEANKPYHAPRKSGFSKYQNVHLISQGAIMLTFILLCLLVGSVVGFLAGLFGIGGGLVIVPTLVYLLPMIGVPEPLLMSAALGTSFATIVITGFSSAQRHHKLGNIEWNAVKVLAPMVMISVFISGLFIGKLDREVSAKIFACLVVYLATKMVISIKKSTGKPNL